MKTWKAVLGVALVFLLGMIAGGLLTARVFRHRIQQAVLGGSPMVRELIVRRLSWQLRLDADQRGQVRTVVAETQRELQALRAQTRPQAQRILTDAEAQVRAVLRPDQAEKFDRLVARARARWDAPGPAPGGE